MEQFTVFDLLRASTHARSFVDARVVRTLTRLVRDGLVREMPTDAVLALACLGDPLSAIRRLVAAGVLPYELPEEPRRLLAARLALDGDELSTRDMTTNAGRIAVFLGLPETHSDTPTPLPTEAGPAYGLFPHQRRAIAQLKALLRKGRTRLLLHMPTGSGKTRTALNLVCDILRENEGRPILWVASTRELLDQAAREFHRAWGILGNREVPVITAWGGEGWHSNDLTDGLLVASLQTIYTRQDEPGFIRDLGRRLGLIVFDEAHQVIAPTYRRTVQQLSAAGQPITPIIGLSATPGRTFVGSQTDEDLAEFFEHTKIELDTGETGAAANPVEYLIQQGYLAKPEFRLLGELPEVDAEPSTTSNDQVELGLNEDNYLTAVVTATLTLIQESHRRVIVFAASVELAHLIAATLRCSGVLADSVDGTTALEVRDTAIRMFKSPTPVPRVLVNYGVLTTGFDAPQTSAVVIARPTRSLVLYSQMVGRGIRGPKAGGNKKAVVVTVVDPSVPAFGSIASAFTHWENLW
ncbi:DEAD/DEAH box helicase [Saccharothrix algeriensis]|uniref:Superfamily II DNA or RNA helicase n=1 Tax=Saccharothrix algeriensis TaxID=173560 RepID=A0ABS2SA87_9PSEU|nr:DEAD/DEAH box helicase [Saccharothrix algeriensis]MBM7813129.1 superfamily II DNA or RNA helicase [Saccharothrix algeriensis]